MKRIIFPLIVLATLCFTSWDVFGQNGNEPVPSFVEGDNLSIGSGNSLEPSGLVYVGNAIGSANKLCSENSLAVGYLDSISTNSANAVALGSRNYIQGESSMAFGSYVRVNGNQGIGIGNYITVMGSSKSMVIGSGVSYLRGLYDQGNGTYVPLTNSVSNSLAIGFNSTKPTLFVSESPNSYSQSVFDRTGRVAIGDVTPQAKLHIRSDEDEDAGFILVPADPTENSAFIRLHDNYHHVTVGNDGVMTLSASSSNRLSITSSNFNVVDGTAIVGTTTDSRLYLSASPTPCVTSNAVPGSGGYSRSAHGPSYALEFGDKDLVLRTAAYADPRNTPITNWMIPITIGIDGVVTLNGKVGINTKNATNEYALAVDGGVITTKVHIQEVNDWEDRVFDGGYPLMSLNEVEEYVATNRHLPGVPSEAEVKAKGFDLAGMQAVLLGKIEELMLYTIRQQREIDSLRDLVTVRFGYDTCGNRISRMLEFSKMDGEKSTGGAKSGATQWQASLSDSFAGMEIMLFPNPTRGGFFLTFSGKEIPNDTKATLCSVDGKTIEERRVGGFAEEFDLGGMPAGIYLLRLSSGDTVTTWKIVKR